MFVWDRIDKQKRRNGSKVETMIKVNVKNKTKKKKTLRERICKDNKFSYNKRDSSRSPTEKTPADGIRGYEL